MVSDQPAVGILPFQDIARYILRHANSWGVILTIWCREITIVGYDDVSARDAIDDILGKEFKKVSLDEHTFSVLHSSWIHSTPIRILADMIAQMPETIATYKRP
jgi:hypothetical protein